MISKKITRPSLCLWLTESFRAILELVSYCREKKQLMEVKTGDRHPVLVIPGFMAGDFSTHILRGYLDKIGYESYSWNLGRNLGGDRYYEKVQQRLIQIHQKSQKKVSLIGWSLGGLYARQSAKLYPDLVRQVITLGSPYAGILEPNNAAWIYTLITRGNGLKDLNQDILQDLPKPTPVPTTSIYSKKDGIVSWRVCMEKNLNAYRQNIEVVGSHIGLGHNPSVLNVVGDRLLYSQRNWVKFKPDGSVGVKLLYPNY